MANPLTPDTTVTLGLLATVSGFIIGAFKWVASINKKIDRNHTQLRIEIDTNHAKLQGDISRHTIQLDDIDERSKANSKLHDIFNDKLSFVSDRMARIETKIDMILEKKLK